MGTANQTPVWLFCSNGIWRKIIEYFVINKEIYHEEFLGISGESWDLKEEVYDIHFLQNNEKYQMKRSIRVQDLKPGKIEIMEADT